MSLESVVNQLVEERSLEALEMLTGSRNDEVLDAIIEAAGLILGSDRVDPSDDGIVEGLREHLIELRPVGLLIDALKHPDATTREFALSCLGEIGDVSAVEPMLAVLESGDPGTREAAAEHLALLTNRNFGLDLEKWREWQNRRIQGLEEQVLEDREDEARRLKLMMRGRPTEEDGR